MNYKWKPSKTARQEFAKKINTDIDFANVYNERRLAKSNKRRSASNFDYESAGGEYVPTKEQYDFCFYHLDLFIIIEERTACNAVIFGYSCNEKIDHDFIHIINEKRRKYLNNNLLSK